ncbi:MAG TPA: hypothetical protein VEW72_13775 [Burkholderiales bacterium]|nr:hypothetical protein [Burkholderiales bacterium]
MKQLIAIALCSLFAACSLPTFAGVAPNHGASQYERSGANIASVKSAAEEKKENQEETMEPAK